MERSEKRKRNMWGQKRASSILCLGIGLLATMYVGKTLYQYISTSIEVKKLTEVKEQMISENKYLNQQNDRLQDDAYFSIYIREHYQYNGTNVIKVPSK